MLDLCIGACLTLFLLVSLAAALVALACLWPHRTRAHSHRHPALRPTRPTAAGKTTPRQRRAA
jgi:hypothetical protein